MGQAAAVQWQAALWQQVGQAKAVARAACVHYTCCTGQHRVASRDARGQRRVTMWLTGYATLMCVSANQEHSSPITEARTVEVVTAHVTFCLQRSAHRRSSPIVDSEIGA